jgi:hypothetical protein
LEGEIVGFPQSDLDILYARYNEITESDKTEEMFFENESFDDLNDGTEQDDSQLKFDEQFVSYAIPQDDIDEFEKKLSDIKMFISDLNKSPSDILTTNKIFGKKRTTHLYTLWTYLALIKIPDDVGGFKAKYEEFFDIFEKLEKTDESDWQDIEIDETKRKIAISYYTDATGATTEEPQRQARLEALKQFLAV